MANGDTISRKASKALGRSQQPLAGALARTSEVLSEISSVIGDLEDVVGHAIGSAASVRELQIEELQKLDHVRQKIAGAAEFLEALSRSVPRDWLVDSQAAARAVPLTALAQRLGGGAPPSREAIQAAAPADEYELF